VNRFFRKEKKDMKIRITLLTVVLLSWTFYSYSAAAELKPSRVLVIIGNQWADPESNMIDSAHVKPAYEEFRHIVALLTIWGVGFDILRLDQEYLMPSSFLDGYGNSRYGCVIWDADTSSIPDANLAAFDKYVRSHHVGVIGIGDRIRGGVIEKLLGVKLQGEAAAQGEMKVDRGHFITREFAGRIDPNVRPPRLGGRAAVVSLEGATSLGTLNGNPLLTVNDAAAGTRGVWIGGHSPTVFSISIDMRFVLQRALVWCTGYMIYKNYQNVVNIVIDDFGNVRTKATEDDIKKDEYHAKLWRYPAMTKEQVRDVYIDTLKKNHAIVDLFIVTGAYDEEKDYVRSPWRLKVPYGDGIVNDMPSTRDGIKEGVAEGVFEIGDHGWTHHGVGPWKLVDNVLGDNNLIWQMRSAIRSLEEHFGVRPLASRFYHMRAEGRVGLNPYGAYADSVHSISFDGVDDFVVLAIPEAWKYMKWEGNPVRKRTYEIKGRTVPGEVPLLLSFHDRDVYYDNGFLQQVFDALGANMHYIGLDELIAYMHSGVTGALTDNELNIDFDYSSHYCRFFKQRLSAWRLHLSDETRAKLAALTLAVDGKPVGKKWVGLPPETVELSVPAGSARHMIQLKKSQ
jgi:hypothetical protein